MVNALILGERYESVLVGHCHFMADGVKQQLNDDQGLLYQCRVPCSEMGRLHSQNHKPLMDDNRGILWWMAETTGGLYPTGGDVPSI